MKLYDFKNFEDYRETQEEGNIRKIDNVWVDETVIDKISEYILENIKNPSLGICHGTRRGVEQQLFIDKLNIEVIGTEISSTATQFPNTIQWDFHDIKDEWVNNIDFIYTNAIDHSYNPSFAMSQWLKCLKDDGLCFIEYTRFNKRHSKLDCFAATKKEMKKLLEKIGVIVDIIKINGITTTKSGIKKSRKYDVFVVRKNV